jgi:hypothetical protein
MADRQLKSPKKSASSQAVPLADCERQRLQSRIKPYQNKSTLADSIGKYHNVAGK